MSHLLYLMFRCDKGYDGKFGKFGNFVGTKHTLSVYRGGHHSRKQRKVCTSPKTVAPAMRIRSDSMGIRFHFILTKGVFRCPKNSPKIQTFHHISITPKY